MQCPFQSLYLSNAKQQKKATFAAAHRYGISFVGFVLILHDARTSVETRCKANSVANTLHTIIQVGEADRSVRSVEVNFRRKKNVADDRWFGENGSIYSAKKRSVQTRRIHVLGTDKKNACIRYGQVKKSSMQDVISFLAGSYDFVEGAG
jgi:hypothetical protein